MTTFAQGDIPYASATDTLAGLAKNTTATRYVANTGPSNAPAYDQVNLGNGVTSTLTSLHGGTGLANATTTFGYVLVGAGDATYFQVPAPYRQTIYQGIDGKVAGAVAVYTVPTGKTFHLFDVVVRPNTVTGYVDAPILTVGVSGGYNQWCGARPLFNHDTGYDESLAQSEAIGNGNPIHYIFQSEESVYVNVSVAAATTTVFTFDVLVYGMFN